MHKIIILSLTALFSMGVSAQDQARGTVFEDLNNNGKKDRREKGIPEVAVTNGLEVVLTDKNGKYRLPVGDDNIIAVIKPADYLLRVDEHNSPQFYYIHKPAGSPESEFEGVKPTGKLPRSVDFPLLPVSGEETDDFTALIFGDPQPYTEEELEFFAKGIISEVEGIENIQFGLSLGDLVGNDLDLFQPYKETVGRVGIPWFNLIGNHDLNLRVKSDEYSDETYEAHFGPSNYAFNHGKVHFIILDNVLHPDPRDGSGVWAGFREDQLSFIKNDLKFVPKDHLIVLAFHIPLTNSFRTADRDSLFSLLKEYPHTLSLSAHSHMQRQDFIDGSLNWMQETPHHHYNVGTTSGDWYQGKLNEQGVPIATMRDGTPKGYAFIHFDGNEYSIDYKVAGKDKDHRMTIFNPKVVATGKKTKAGIYVNFFMGGEQDKVMYRIDNGKWEKMEHVLEQDPSYEILVYEWDLTEELLPGRRSSTPVESTHLWRGGIPTDLGVGEHKIEVKVTDMFGRTFTDTSSFRLADPVE